MSVQISRIISLFRKLLHDLLILYLYNNIFLMIYFYFTLPKLFVCSVIVFLHLFRICANYMYRISSSHHLSMNLLNFIINIFQKEIV